MDRVKDLVGDHPPDVAWHDVAKGFPPFLAARLGPAMAEGVAWKFAPLQAFPDRYELSLDNDCILWKRPAAIDNWLKLGGRLPLPAPCRRAGALQGLISSESTASEWAGRSTVGPPKSCLRNRQLVAASP